MSETNVKLITPEYHDGQSAYHRGQALTSNPYLNSAKHIGQLWYWDRGFQDALADDVRAIKQMILSAAGPIDKETMN